MKILIVEDEAAVVGLMKRTLRPYASEIWVASTRAEFVHHLATKPRIDIVFLDLRLPDSNMDQTIDTIPDIRESHPEVTIMVITGANASNDTKQRALDGGADMFASKQEVLLGQGALLMAVWNVLRGKKTIKPSPSYEKHIRALEQFVSKITKENPNVV